MILSACRLCLLHINVNKSQKQHYRTQKITQLHLLLLNSACTNDMTHYVLFTAELFRSGEVL
jgi:hypothetical protein